MEKRETHYKQQPRRKSQIGYPGVGPNIGGLIVAGGALAVASFVAFALRRGKRKGDSGGGSGSDTSDRHQMPEKQESEQGRGFVIQSSPSNPCCSGNGSIKVVATQTITCELVPTEMIKEQKSASDIQCNCREEISLIGKDSEKVLLSDDSKRNGTESCELRGEFEEFSTPKLKNVENGSLMEVTEVVEEGKPMDAVEGKITEITSSMRSVTLEEKDDGGVDKDDHKEEEEVDKDDHKEAAAAAMVKQEKEELAFVGKSGEDDYVDTGFGKAVDAVEAKKTDITSSMPLVMEEEKYDSDVDKDDHKEEEAALEEKDDSGVDKDDHNEEAAAVVVKQAEEESAFVEISGEDDYDDTGYVKAVDAVEAKKTERTSSMPSVMEEEKYDIDVDKDDHKEESAAEDAKEKLPLVEICGENYGRNDSIWVERNERELIDSTSQASAHSVAEKEEKKDSVVDKHEDNLQGVESSHIGSQAEETQLPVESEEQMSQENNCTLQQSVSVTKIMEGEQSKTIKLGNGKTDPLYDSRDNYQTTQNSMFWQKGGTNFSRWTMQVRHVVVLLLAFMVMVLLFFTNHNVLSLSVSFSYS